MDCCITWAVGFFDWLCVQCSKDIKKYPYKSRNPYENWGTSDTVVVMNINLSNLIIGLLTTSIVFTSPVSAVVIHASNGE